eukprot:15365428-Ditylum_brightwellii.AAC.1
MRRKDPSTSKFCFRIHRTPNEALKYIDRATYLDNAEALMIADLSPPTDFPILSIIEGGYRKNE